MAEDQKPKKVETQEASEPPAPEPEAQSVAELPKDVAEEKSVIPHPLPPSVEEKQPEEEKPKPAEKVPEPVEEKLEGSVNRDAVLARVQTEKRMSLVRAWEESEKCKAENKAHKKLSAIGSWENSKKASLEAELKKIEEKLEKQKAEYIEKMKNKIALIHKGAEEKRAMVEAKRGEDILKAEETAAKYRATGSAPRKLLGFF